MKTAYFSTNIETLDALQTEYRQLVRRYHPDMHAGESAERIAEYTAHTQKINAEYAQLAALLRFADASAKAKERGKPAPSNADVESWARADERIREAIEKIIYYPNLEIELCGFWVWVSGETRPVKEHLKGAGYRWANKKEKWYFAGIPSASRGAWDMDDIRARYGSTRIETKERERVGGDV